MWACHPERSLALAQPSRNVLGGVCRAQKPNTSISPVRWLTRSTVGGVCFLPRGHVSSVHDTFTHAETHSLHTTHLRGGGRSFRPGGLGSQHASIQGRPLSARYWWIEQQHGHRM